jgi:hypothetical protein
VRVSPGCRPRDASHVASLRASRFFLREKLSDSQNRQDLQGCSKTAVAAAKSGHQRCTSTCGVAAVAFIQAKSPAPNSGAGPDRASRDLSTSATTAARRGCQSQSPGCAARASADTATPPPAHQLLPGTPEGTWGRGARGRGAGAERRRAGAGPGVREAGPTERGGGERTRELWAGPAWGRASGRRRGRGLAPGAELTQ